MNIIRDFPSSEYHQRDAISSSLLRSIHEHDSVIHGSWHHRRVTETSAMVFGSTVHGIVLEGKKFEDFGFAPPCPVRTPTPAQWKTFNEKRANDKTTDQCIQYQAWKLAHSDAVTFDDADWDRALAVVQALREHRFAGPLLAAKTETELSIFGEEAIDDGGEVFPLLPVKARIDFLSAAYERGIPDLKVSKFITRKAWQRNVLSHGLFYQIGHYVKLAQAAGIDVSLNSENGCWAWIVVDPDPPHRVEVYTADAEMVRRSIERRDAVMKRIAQGDKPLIQRIAWERWAEDKEVETEVVE